MYRTCLFCNSDLGHNEAVEHFPVGRRLAFDASEGPTLGRLPQVRAMEPHSARGAVGSDRGMRARLSRHALRVSTDQIGLARLREGLELVRIGDPQRPEMAAWRYGDQFGRRRRRKYLIAGGVVVAAATVVVAGPVLGIVGAGAISPMTNLIIDRQQSLSREEDHRRSRFGGPHAPHAARRRRSREDGVARWRAGAAGPCRAGEGDALAFRSESRDGHAHGRGGGACGRLRCSRG